MRQVVNNLTTNAGEGMPQSGTVKARPEIVLAVLG